MASGDDLLVRGESAVLRLPRVKCPVHGVGQEPFTVHFSGLPSVTRCLACVRDAFSRSLPEVETDG